MLEAQFTAWRAGDRVRLLEWWRADRARAWARAARLDPSGGSHTAAVIRRMAAHPEFAHLVPFPHPCDDRAWLLAPARAKHHERFFPFAGAHRLDLLICVPPPLLFRPEADYQLSIIFVARSAANVAAKSWGTPCSPGL